MKEERLKILKMLQEGTITAQEAERLLEAVLGNTGNGLPSLQHEDRPEGLGSMILRGIKNTMADVLQNNYETADFTLPVDTDIKKLDLMGKNGKVYIERISGKTDIHVECMYIVKNRYKDVFSVRFDYDQSGSYTLVYDQSQVKFMSVSCIVPDNMVEHVCAKTSNSSIDLQNLHCGLVNATTSNSAIKAERVTAHNTLDLQTSNSKIAVEDTSCPVLKLSTSNGKIAVREVSTTQVFADTSNAAISIKKISAYSNDVGNGNKWANLNNNEDMTVKANTSNGSITLELPQKIGIKLQASTSHGSIKYDLSDGIEGQISSHSIVGQNQLYQDSGKGLFATLSTSNGSIKIKEN